MSAGMWLRNALIPFCIFCLSAAAPAEEPEFATEVAVRIGKISRATLHRYVMAYGMVEPEPAMAGKPAASSRISSPAAGILSESYCEEGQTVKKGALLFELDTRGADALIAKSEVAVEFAQKNFERKRQLFTSDNVSRKLYDEAEQWLQSARKDLLIARTQRELLRIKTPLSGVVAAMHFKAGEAVSQNAVLAEVIALERLNIAIRLPSSEAAVSRLRQPVEISAGFTLNIASDGSETVLRGRVTFIGSQVDPLTDTVLVRASLGSGSGLRSGQFVSVRILVEERPGRLAAPIESVVNREGASFIALVEGDEAKLINIKLGLRDGHLVEVEGGNIQEGMAIVTSGVYGLPPRTRIREEK